MRVQVKDFMSTPVHTSLSTDKVSDVRMLFAQQQIHASPVLLVKDAGQTEPEIAGIVTSNDVNQPITDDVSVSDVMSTKVLVVHQNTGASSAANMMLKHDVHHLVVMHDGGIVGMISSLDFVKLVGQYNLEE